MQKTIGGLSVFIEGDKKNKAIIFLHGFPYDHTVWQAQVEALSEAYYCIAYDIKGLGASSVGDGQFTMESFVDDLETIIQELDLEKPIVCAHSMGGYIILRALERKEELFSAVILCDTSSSSDSDEKKIDRSDAIGRINAYGVRTFSKNFITRCYGETYKKQFKEDIKKRVAKSSSFNSIGVKGCILAMITRTDTTAYLSKMAIPALLLCGEQDTLSTPEKMQEMASKISKAQYVGIPESGHMSMIENPLEINRAIKDFLATL